MKKIIALLMGLILIFVCVSCSSTDTAPKIDSTVDAVAEYLGLGSGEMVLFQMIEAKDGKQYQNGKVEIYQYSTTDATYKMIENKEYILTADALNNGFVLIIVEDIDNKQDLINKFNAIKFK